MHRMLSVELVYIPTDQQSLHLHLDLPAGANVSDVLKKSGWLQSHPEIADYPVGIFGTRVLLTQLIKSRDRIEIYRPLLIDPKEKRRQRARS